MKPRLNVLWLMSDQHNANCTGYRGHPNVKTPALDRIAASCVGWQGDLLVGQAYAMKQKKNDTQQTPTTSDDGQALRQCEFRP